MASLTVRIGAEVTDFQSKVGEVGRSLSAVRSPIQAFSSALSNAGRIARLMGDDGKKLASQIDTLTIATSAATVAVQSFRAVLASLPVVIAAVRLALATLLGPLGLAIAGLTALSLAAGFLIKRHLDAAQATREHASALDRAAASAQRFTAATRSLTFLQQEHVLSHDDLRMAADRAAKGIAELGEIEARAAKEARDAARQVASERKRLAEQARAEEEQRFQDQAAQIVAYNIWERNQWEQAAQARTEAFIKATDAIIEDQERLKRETLDLIGEFNRQAIVAIDEREKAAIEAAENMLEAERKLAEEGADLIRRANQDVVDALEAQMEAQRRAALETKPLWVQQAEAVAQSVKEVSEAFVGSFQSAFKDLFSDILSGARSFGDALVNFFGNIVNSIINILSRMASIWIVNLLFGLKLPFFAKGGIVSGGLTPAFAGAFSGGGVVPGGLVPTFAGMQHGGVIHRPTLAMVGEGGQSEAVIPLPDNRHVPVEFTGGPEQRKTEITIPLQVNIVRGPSEIMTPAEFRQAVVVTVVDDGRQRGAIYRLIKEVRNG